MSPVVGNIAFAMSLSMTNYYYLKSHCNSELDPPAIPITAPALHIIARAASEIIDTTEPLLAPACPG